MRAGSRAVLALFLALWIPTSFFAPLASAAPARSMACCRTKARCCCKKSAPPSDGVGLQPAAQCAGSCSRHVTASPGVAHLTVPAETSGHLTVAPGAVVAGDTIVYQHLYEPCLHQRPPPVHA